VEALHHYDMSLKKDGLYVSLASDDMIFISRQMDKWFHILLDENSRPPLVTATKPTAQSVPIAAPPQQVAQAPVESATKAKITPANPPPSFPRPEPEPELELEPELEREPQAQAPQAPVSIPEVPSIEEPVAQAVVPAVESVQTPIAPAAIEPSPVAVENLANVLPEEPKVELPAGPEIIPQAVTPVEAEKVAVAEAPAAVVAPPESIPPVKPAGLPELDLKPVEVPVMPESIAPPESAESEEQDQVLIPVAPPSIHERLAAHHAATSMKASITPEAPPALVEPIIPTEPVDDFDAIMNSVMQDLDAEELPEAALGAEDLLPTENISSLTDLCQYSTAETTDELLLLAAYYLTTFEQQKNFTLKQLNSSLVKAGKSPVNHGVLEVALQQGTLDMVPDLNGTAEISEYRLTDQGDVAANKLLR
jgi:hypothetical protein